MSDQKRRKTPPEKKRLSLVRDRRNTYGENDKSSRKNIRRGKQRGQMQLRRAVAQQLQLPGPLQVAESEQTSSKVAEVQVVGIPDERLGEVVVAWIRLKASNSATAEEIRDFCEGQIAYFKIPQHVRFVDEFPMTVTGKIQKFRMREIEIKERGLEEVAGRETA